MNKTVAGGVVAWDWLKEVIFYDQETGVFTWRVAISRNVKAGDIAGNLEPQGYIRISLRDHSYRAHRLAFFYMTGAWPQSQVDHRNGIRSDNRWENLRPATPSENQQNKAIPKRNTSGFLGVSQCPRTKRWRATIRAEGRQRVLGHFDTPEKASDAYLSARAELYPFQKIPRQVRSS